jgi:Flp pilus assembly protein TadD
VSSQLIDASTGTHLWAETYDRDLTAGEIFSVQDDITNRVVATLAAAEGVLTRSGASKLRAKPPGSLDAYEAVLRTFSYWDRQGPDEHLEVRETLERAVQVDPQYGHAWACLSIVHLDEFRVGFNPRPDPLERALAAALRSVDLDPTGHLSQHALAQVHFYRGDLEAFFPAAQKGVELNPNDSTIVAMTGLLTAYAGEWESGLAMLEKAMALNPYHPGWYYFPMAFNHYRNGDYGSALEEARKVNMPGYHPNHMALAAIYGQLGRAEEARAAIENLLELFPGYEVRASEELGKWFRTPGMLAHIVEGLRKAGLEIPED